VLLRKHFFPRRGRSSTHRPGKQPHPAPARSARAHFAARSTTKRLTSCPKILSSLPSCSQSVRPEAIFRSHQPGLALAACSSPQPNSTPTAVLSPHTEPPQLDQTGHATLRLTNTRPRHTIHRQTVCPVQTPVPQDTITRRTRVVQRSCQPKPTPYRRPETPPSPALSHPESARLVPLSARSIPHQLGHPPHGPAPCSHSRHDS
jgi:hypothetical protein